MQTLAPICRRPVIGCLLSVFIAAGCGFGTTPIVHGIVILDGRPLHSGTVVFHFGDGRETYAGISESGEYRMEDKDKMSEGVVSITVIPNSPNPFKTAVSRNGSHKTVLRQTEETSGVPERYMDVSTTDLECTIKRGDNEHKIELNR
jgi:hypothetical protein